MHSYVPPSAAQPAAPNTLWLTRATAPRAPCAWTSLCAVGVVRARGASLGSSSTAAQTCGYLWWPYAALGGTCCEAPPLAFRGIFVLWVFLPCLEIIFRYGFWTLRVLCTDSKRPSYAPTLFFKFHSLQASPVLGSVHRRPNLAAAGLRVFDSA